MEESLSRSGSRSSSVCDLEKDFADVELTKKSRKSVILRTPPARKAKRVRFFRNGDKFFSGVVIPVLAERYRSFDSLTSDLTRVLVDNVTLPSGVRTIYSLDGKKVSSLDDLEDGKSYVCSGKGETFKKLDYNSLSSSRLGTPENPNGPLANNTTGNNKSTQNNRLSRLFNGTGSPYSNNGTSNGKIGAGDVSVVRARIVTIIRNGIKPRKVFRLLLNKRNSPSFEHVLSAITECIKLDTGCVRRVFTLAARPVLQLEHFFQDEDVFFAYGNERYSQEDFELEFEESKAVQQYKKTPTLRNGARNAAKPKMPCKVGKERKNVIKCGSPGYLDNDKDDDDDDEDEDASNFLLPQALRLKYTVGKIIGKGTFAKVRTCQERISGREFAIKIIDKEKCKGKEYYVEAEVRIMKRVCHPRIVSLFEEHDTPDRLHLVMELVKGGDLFDSITVASKFTEDQARLMITHLASAVAYLHSMSIVHRDIKLENLLVESIGDQIIGLKLGDFGLASEVDRPLFTVCGTPTYVAPEMLLETGYGVKIDVWAMGVILYILLCGFPPFVAKDDNQDYLYDSIICGQYCFPKPFWTGISIGARDLIANMLQHSPDCRFGAEDILDHAWLSFSYTWDPDADDSNQEDENDSF